MTMLSALLKARERFPQLPRVIVATIDHGLRPGSGADAALVCSAAAASGLEGHILRPAWSMPPSSAVQAEARRERLRLLRKLCLSHGQGGAILVAHTADDLAETVSMRDARQGGSTSSLRGLAGMPFATWMFGAWMLRPFLHIRRNFLRDWASRHGVVWREDPSNKAIAFERVRVRKRLDRYPNAANRLLRTAREGAIERVKAAGGAAMVLREGGLLWPGLPESDRPERLRGSEFPQHAMLALRTAVAFVGGLRYLPAVHGDPSMSMLRFNGVRCTVGRCYVIREGKELQLSRELRRTFLADAFAGSRRTFQTFWGAPVWDGRWAILSLSPDVALHRTIGHGTNVWEAKDRPRLDVRQHGQVQRLLAPYGEMLPGWDWDLASALADLAGLKPPPEPPFPRTLNWQSR